MFTDDDNPNPNMIEHGFSKQSDSLTYYSEEKEKESDQLKKDTILWIWLLFKSLKIEKHLDVIIDRLKTKIP